jgi:preprotein translocase subunit YajC
VNLLIIYIVVIAGLFLFMQRRSANKRRVQQEQTSNLVPGAEVRTIGGLLGTVTEVDDESVTVETTPGVQLRFIKSAIAGITSTPEAPSVFDAVPTTDEAEGADAEDELKDAVPDAAPDAEETAAKESAGEGDAAESSDDNVPAGESVLSASEKK